jgi:phenylalanyl-tRNA synthetase beta chain
MKVSYAQLQNYFDEKLPSPEKLAEAFTFHAFEVESVEKSGEDVVFDLKVLPDRASYAKTPQGIAREVSAILGLKKKPEIIPSKDISRKIACRIDRINEVLGVEVPRDEVVSILKRLDIDVEESGNELVLTVPKDRLDLWDWRDIPEEIGRIYGYDKVPSILPSNTAFKPKVQGTFYYAEKIKNILVERGFSELYMYSLASKGDFEIEKSVASDKNFLRVNLTEGMVKALELNAKNADLLGLDEIKIFEIGRIFPKEGERTSLCVGIKNLKKKDVKANEKIKIVRDELMNILGANASILCTIDDTGGIISLNGRHIGVTNNVEGILELDLDALIASLPEPTSYSDLNFGKAVNVEYGKFSPYPFIVRDIAVFVPEGTDSKTLQEILALNGGELLVNTRLFDVFTKEGKTSYAYRLVFQAKDRTLTDAEPNAVMEKIYEEVKKKGWEVR